MMGLLAAFVCIRAGRESNPEKRIRPRDIIYTGGVARPRERRGRNDLTATTPAMAMVMVVVPQVMVMVERLLLAAVAPGHDSRAPVFEYNALYCPRHIIYLLAK